MPFDLASVLAGTGRAVRNLEEDGKPAKAVVLSQLYDTDLDDLWDAVTRPERLRRWFGNVSGDLQLGGHFHIENNASGTILDCRPQQLIVVSWEFGATKSQVTARLTSEPDGARLEVEHLLPVDPHWEQFGPSAVGTGWDLWITALARHLAAPDYVLSPEEAEAWFYTDEARGMIRTACESWAAADMANGEDAAHARQTAEASRRFYTGEAAPGQAG
jgi:uncharacterized protein YndB with AHSA1/START domain